MTKEELQKRVRLPMKAVREQMEVPTTRQQESKVMREKILPIAVVQITAQTKINQRGSYKEPLSYYFASYSHSFYITSYFKAIIGEAI